MKLVLKIITLITILINTFIIISSYYSIFGIRCMRIISGSMVPTININSIVIIKEDKNISVGDIVTYLDKGDYITHKVIEIDGENIITKGDSNNANDKPINISNIVGKKVFVIDNITYTLLKVGCMLLCIIFLII